MEPSTPSLIAFKDLAPLDPYFEKRLTAKHSHKATNTGTPACELDTPGAIARAITYLEDEAPEAVQEARGDETTLGVAYACKDIGLSEGKTLELMLEHWNGEKASPPWSPDDLQTKVRNAYLYGQRAVGAGSPNAEFEAVELNETPRPKKRGLHHIGFKHGAHSALDAVGDPLIEDLLNTGDLSVLYGKSGSGKTFHALDLAFHVASGRPWHGNRAVKQGLVIYVAAEGGKGILKRLAALDKHFQPDSDIPLAVIPCPIDLLSSGKHSDTRQLIDLVREIEAKYGQKAELLIVDTLSRALAGGDENASTDMGTFVQHIDQLRTEIQTHVMVVHHSGKEQSRGARGWSGIRAAVDTEIEVHEGMFTAMKQRDIDAIQPIPFRLKQIPIGRFRDKEVNSCVVEYMTPAQATFEAAKSAATQDDLQVLIGLAEAQTNDGGKCRDVFDIELTSKAIGAALGVQKSDALSKRMAKLLRDDVLVRVRQGIFRLKLLVLPEDEQHAGEQNQ